MQLIGQGSLARAKLKLGLVVHRLDIHGALSQRMLRAGPLLEHLATVGVFLC